MAETTPIQKKPSARKQRRGGGHPTKNGPKPTRKQLAARDAILREMLSPTGKSLVEILVEEGGYAEESARQFTNIMSGIKPLLDPLVERIEKHRAKVLEKMEERIEMADYAQLTRGLDTTTKVHRLLTGKSTHNLGVLVADRRSEIDRLIDE